jgi:hypothetical protein
MTRVRTVAAFPCLPAFLALLLCACAENEVKPLAAADPVDMSGNWELDYARSDNLQARFNAMLRELRERASRSSADNSRGGAVVSAGGSQESLLGLAQMAELITQSQLLEVEQNRVAIRVEREGNFSLSCDYGPDAPQLTEYGLGNERCFWDGRQLVFQIRLPDGLDIVHRLSVSASGETLGILTSLRSSGVSAPFTVRRIYRRYEPGSSGYRCTETLSRGRVCTTESR